MNLAILRNRKHIQRPLAVTWLAGLVFLLGAANLSIVGVGLTRRSVFNALSLSVSLPVLITLGGLWTIVWIGTAWGLFRLKRWSRIATPVLFVVYESLSIGRQAFFAQESYARGRLGFSLILGGMLLGLIILILNHPQIRESFGRSEPGASEQA